MKTLMGCAPRFLSLVLLVLVAVAVVPTVADAQLSATGQWTTLPYLVPINPIHVALLKNGKVLIVAGSEQVPTATTFKTAVWDPATGTFAQQLTPWDLFCNGMTFLPDGRVIMTGGNLDIVDPGPGAPWTTIFDPATEQFYQLENMAAGRWYPGNVMLSDGGTMTFGGLNQSGAKNNTTEIYDLDTGWNGPYPGFNTGWYPRLHLLPNGTVFNSSPNRQSHFFNPATGGWSNGPLTKYTEDRMYGASVMLPLSPASNYKPKILIFGGNSSGATATVESIDLSVASPTWVNVPPMSVPRVTLNAVLLPNGKILALGGSTLYNQASTAHLNAETFDPVSQTWTPSGSGAYARLYHSVALLLPDATVWVAGSNPGREIWEPHMEIYKPPYLFTTSGAPAARPVIGTTPSVVGYGQSFAIASAQAASIDKVVLVRPGSTTHSFDTEQRLIEMNFTKTSTTITATTPSSPGVAPPGYYMLFILNGSGVPSVAKFIQLLPNPTNQPPAATITNPSSSSVNITAGQSVTFASTATDTDGSVAKYFWNFPGGSPVKSFLQNPGAVKFSTPGVYTVSLTVFDNVGANDPSPPTVTVTVSGTSALGAAITSPANNSTVNGTVTVNMAATNAQGSPTNFLLKLDNATTLSNQTVSGSTATYAWNTTGLSGTHTLNLTVTDGAGRTANAAITVTIGAGGGDPTPPTVSITAPASGATVSGASVTVSATAADNVGVTSVQFKVDGTNIGAADTTAPYSVTWNTTTATNGTHTLTAVASDAAGNTTTSAPVTVTVSNGTPGPGPQNVVWTSIVNATASGNTLTKSGGCDGCFNAGGVSQQTIASADGSVQFSISAGAFVAAGLSVGNTGTGSEEIDFSLKFYPGSPGIVEVRENNVYKWDFAHVAGAVYKIAVEAGVVKYYQNNTLKYTSAIAPSYPLLFDVALGSTAAAIQNAVITSGSGGGTPPPDPPPSVSITAPASGATVSGASVTISATASDNVGVTNVQFKVDGVNVGAADTTAPYSVTWNTTTVSDGSHTLTAVATDTAGNTTTSAPVTVTVSNPVPSDPPPTVSITAPASGATVSGASVTISATATDNLGVTSVQFQVDGVNVGAADTTTPYSVTWNTTTVSNGSHTLTAVATDTTGNTTTSAPVTVTVSNAPPSDPPPTVSITAPASGATVSGASVTISASASDNVGVTNVQFKVDGVNVGAADTTAPYAVTWNTTTVGNGSHTLTAVATDTAGNTTTSAPVTVTVSNGTPGPGPQNVVWTSIVNATASGNTLTKTGGCDGCGDAGGVSQQTIASGDGAVQFAVTSASYMFAGLSVGNTTTDGSEIDFGLKFYPGSPGIVEVRENNVYKWDFAHVTGAVYKIAVETGVVKYYQNDVLKYTSAIAPAYPLLLDASLGSAGAAVQNAIITTGTGGGSPPPSDPPPTVSISAPAGGATVSGASVTVTATASDNVGVTSVQFLVDGVAIGTDTTTPYSVTWNTTAVANGTHTLTAIATDTAGGTTTSAPVTVTVSNGSPGPGPQNVVWTSVVNATASGNTLTKNAGCDGCFDAGGVSQQVISSGTGAVEFAISAGTFAAAGLGVGNGTAEQIDFSLRFSPGSPGIVEVRENNVYKWDFAHAAGAVYKIAVEAGVVKYYQNGALKYTSAIAPSSPLLFDVALGSSGAAIQGAVITGAGP